MIFEEVFFSLLVFHLVNSHLQINLHLTHWTKEDDNFQHHCLQVPAHVMKESDPRQIISYCMTQFSSKFSIKENSGDTKFTFEELSQQKITNQQLYLWSAPIDLIEQYQFYLNQLAKSEKSSFGLQKFSNCTLPYFGPQCEYILDDYQPYHSSLDEIVHDYYRYNRYEPTLLTCYLHLECNRGPSPSCLDWREICDGKVDCLDTGYDEEHCWQLEIQPYHENEDPLSNRRCISEAFFRDDSNVPDCVGESNIFEWFDINTNDKFPPSEEPTFKQEDISCTKYSNIEKLTYSYSEPCYGTRLDILSQAMFSIKPKWLSDQCWSAVKCIFILRNRMDSTYSMTCKFTITDEIIIKTCPNITYVPAVPILFNHIYMAYEKDALLQNYFFPPPNPTYFCYNDQLLYVSNDNNKKIVLNNNTCLFYDVSRYPSLLREARWYRRYIIPLYVWLQTNTISIDKNSHLLDKSMMYKCIDWPKYISKIRLFDGVADCYHSDDERILNKTCPTEQNASLFKCVTTNECIPIHLVDNKFCDCTKYSMNDCDDEKSDTSYSQTTISFQTICDGHHNLSPNFIDKSNETDETNCEYWPLIHVYNHCDGFWNRPDGSDELNCDRSPLLNCSTNHHICISPTKNELMCLPIEKANDGIIDCLGAADEPTLCKDYLDLVYSFTFYCYRERYISCTLPRDLCDNEQSCPNNEDEQACTSQDLLELSRFKGICEGNYESDGSDVAKVLCRRFSYGDKSRRVHFTLDQWQDIIKRHLKQESTLPYQSTKQSIQSYQPRCHRGLNLQVWIDKKKNLTKNVCLCQPSYYGDTCQYQNQRVSLTLQFQVASDSVQTPFITIASLIDDSDERIIHSSEQFTYVPTKNCRRKFNVYLLYSTRPKDEIKDYSIKVDVYEKETLDYRASFIKLLNFSFLPVHRVLLQIDIPRIGNNPNDCSDNQCHHGKCRKYFNDRNNRTFCQCQNGWSGRFCTISYTSMCSSDSLSIGKLANNRSLCACPVNKIGPQCLIDDPICQNITCLNQGKCIAVDEYQTSQKKFVCICSKDYTGDRCEIARTKFLMTFDQNISLPASILIHFIEVNLDAVPVRTTTFKTISFGQNSMVVYWSLPFHIVFVELLNKTYYLSHVQKIYTQSTIIEKTLKSEDRCLDIKELFNESWANSSLLHRIKYYHLPCRRNSSQLKCFYDEIHLCLCQQIAQQYVANCFEFDHNMNLYCSGPNGCENGGQCFQEQTLCPRVSVCQCPVCYYGARCQLSSTGFSLSLDAILGYHIRPNLSISGQPLAVAISLTLTLIITLLGLTNGTLSLITFQNKILRKTGRGLYLFTASIIVLLTMIVFLLKFVILLLSQMRIMTNYSFLTIQCHSIDFLLRFGLTMDQWLTACVAIERACIIKRLNLSPSKSIFLAKWVITGLVLITIVTNIHDPIYRSLFEENEGDHDDEKRFWCIVKYPPAIHIINLTVNIFHLIIPFIINLVCAFIIIVIIARQQVMIKTKSNYREMLNKQVQQHRNLLIGPCVLIVLGVPRLIISFTSGCMKSASDSWLFLVGYFISYIPPLLTFILFILPSATYKRAFRQMISRYRNIIGCNY